MDAFVFDCEFLTAEGSPQRFWCGPYDPDPVIAQIGIAQLQLSADFPVRDTARIYVIPKDRLGNRMPLDPFFTRLTGITEADLDREGTGLADALVRVQAFIGEGKLWSWGKDEFNMLAISCYVEGIRPPLPIGRFGNACDLLLKAGMPYDDLKKTRSNTLPAYYGLEYPELRGHDALDDALSTTCVLQHLLRGGALSAGDFA